MTNKEIYHQLCEQNSLPLFLQDWWLSGVCAGKQWDVLLVQDEQGHVRAAMPYQTEKHLWQSYVVMPTLTPYGGVWVHPDVQNEQELRAIARNLEEQIEQLHIGFLYQRYFLGARLPQLLRGKYATLHRSTFLLEPTGGADAILKGFSQNKRKKLLEKAADYRVDTLSCEDFYRMHVACNAEKNKQLWYTREALLVQYKKATDRGCCRIICIRDAANHPLAAAVVVWDKERVYQLLNCYIHEQKDNGARERLTLEVLLHAEQLGLSVDFLSHRQYLRHYGAKRHDFMAVRMSQSPLVSLHLLLQRIARWKYKEL